MRLVTLSDAARRLSTTEHGVVELCNGGQLAFLTGAQIQIPEEELSAYIQRRRVRQRQTSAA